MAKGSSTDPAVKRRLLGAEGGFGVMLGLDNDWTLRAIKAVGNYGEVYDEFFGPKALDLARGQNKLWTNGGLQYALPIPVRAMTRAKQPWRKRRQARGSAGLEPGCRR